MSHKGAPVTVAPFKNTDGKTPTILVNPAAVILKTAVAVDVFTVPTQVFVYVAPNCRGTVAEIVVDNDATPLFVVLSPVDTDVDNDATAARVTSMLLLTEESMDVDRD